MTNDRPYYCSQKFWWLTVDIEKSQTLSCCASYPEKIDLNSDDIFNTSKLTEERNNMLANIPVASCNTACWIPESKGVMSRRLLSGSEVISHTEVHSKPEVLHIIVTNQCNLTCVYCCKQYSSAWANDIITNGEIKNVTTDYKYAINDHDKILLKLGQKKIAESSLNQKLLKQLENIIKNNTKLNRIIISGGEPFLYNPLSDLLKMLRLHFDKNIIVQTGLGVNQERLQREIKKLPGDIEFYISAESTNEYYDFVRTRNTWIKFKNNVDTLIEHDFKITFSATISNLTLFGINDFMDYFKKYDVHYSICNDPSFLSPAVMDDASKNLVINSMINCPTELRDLVTSCINYNPTVDDRRRLSVFLKEFTRRQNLDISVYPESFVKWISDVV